MDAVYVLGTGSQKNNEELRYSVRSLVAHCRDLGNVLVIGVWPNTVPGVMYIPAEDAEVKSWKNVYSKITRAAREDALTNDILVMNDDFFFTRDFKAEDWPYFALKGVDGGSSGKLYFGLHCAYRINRKAWLAMPDLAQFSGDFSPRTFYANYYGAKAEFSEDYIATSAAHVRGEWGTKKDRGWFSISNGGALNTEVWSEIERRWPHASRYE